MKHVACVPSYCFPNSHSRKRKHCVLQAKVNCQSKYAQIVSMKIKPRDVSLHVLVVVGVYNNYPGARAKGVRRIHRSAESGHIVHYIYST